MSRRGIMPNIFILSCGVSALVGMLLLGGCNSEPTGDAAFGQKFEVPPDLAEDAKKPAPPPLTRDDERKQDIMDAQKLKKKARKSR